jgi:hypothetical protein
VVCPKPKKYRYIESVARKTVLSKLVISCQYDNQKSISTDCIYRISYKIAKRQTPEKGSALFKNDITSSEPISKLGIHSSYLESAFLADFGNITGFTPTP